MKIIEVQNHCHMGDQIINFIFFNQIKNYIEINNIFIKYYCYERYHKNLFDFNPSNNISIHPLKPYLKKYYVLWQGDLHGLNPNSPFIEDALIFMFNLFLKHFKIDIIVDKFEYDYPKIIEWYDFLDNKYKNADILIINSTPLSGQYIYNKKNWDMQIIELSKKYKILTTENVNENILSLEKLPLKDICAISTNVKYIISIDTGPLMPLFNKYTLNNVENIYIFSCNVYKSRKCISNPIDLMSCIK